MSRLAKFTIIIGVCLMSLGLIISKGDVIDIFNQFQYAENYEKQVIEIDAETLKKIFIDAPEYNVEIIPTDGDKIIVTYYESDFHEFDYEQTTTSFSLKKKSKWRFFVFDFNWGRHDTITIEIPDNLTLAYDIETTNGNIKLEGLDVIDSSLRTTNGSINVRKVFTDDGLALKTTNGSINLNIVEASVIDAKTTNGTVNIKNTEAFNKIEARTTNGRIELTNLIASNIRLDNTNGSIKGNIVGDEIEYQREMKTSNGSITINGTKYSNKINDSKKKDNYIYAKTTNGSINLDIE